MLSRVSCEVQYITYIMLTDHISRRLHIQPQPKEIMTIPFSLKMKCRSYRIGVASYGSSSERSRRDLCRFLTFFIFSGYEELPIKMGGDKYTPGRALGINVLWYTPPKAYLRANTATSAQQFRRVLRLRNLSVIPLAIDCRSILIRQIPGWFSTKSRRFLLSLSCQYRGSVPQRSLHHPKKPLQLDSSVQFQPPSSIIERFSVSPPAAAPILLANI